jgi:hypothetical protein
MSSLIKTRRYSSDMLILFPNICRIIGPCFPNTKYPSLLTLLIAYKSYSYSKGYSVILANSLGTVCQMSRVE